jgi:hypothetical protein
MKGNEGGAEMKKMIVFLALLTPRIALAEGSFTTIYPGISDDHKMIFTNTDDGGTRTSNAFKVSDDMWLVFDNEGGCSTVFDFSNDGPDSVDD